MVELKIFSKLQDIPKEAWSELIGSDFPFSEYEYLMAMEAGGCVGRKAGWVPCYLTCWEEKSLLGAIYLYLKNNSYGEYIFDWGWANAYMQHGVDYYPKLVSAVPFTPATGKKILVHPNADSKKISTILLRSAGELMDKWQCSSLHFLFIPPSEVPVFEDAGFMVRHSTQYHWKNRDYSDFDNFLDTLKGKRRKEILRERRKVKEQNIEIKVFRGDELLPEHSRIMYEFYLSTIYKMGAIDYLSLEFFEQVFRVMKDQIVLVLARADDRWVAGSINYHKGKGLYGRYWGCLEEFKNLHFELCYYQTIEFAIAQKIQLFEAGAQGRHKVQRGFLQEIIYSAHWIVHDGFREAISEFIEQEKNDISSSIAYGKSHQPYKSDQTEI
ncbi:MAG: N-acetyltransferase [SAR324 cluster bacterium]|nr:N-acetyltransferase [SAR324 cluster bacterium]